MHCAACGGTTVSFDHDMDQRQCYDLPPRRGDVACRSGSKPAEGAVLRAVLAGLFMQRLAADGTKLRRGVPVDRTMRSNHPHAAIRSNDADPPRTDSRMSAASCCTGGVEVADARTSDSGTDGSAGNPISRPSNALTEAGKP